ncbi:MAG TPA: redox-sensing transcriptional repressor Rex [Acidimicrobiales bacterium]|nr:redox-sensing transcriptional repressor Rex [Acidimicrobiales bacterium]
MPSGRNRIPEATVSRLPVYLRVLLDLSAEQMTTVSSERLAALAGVNAAKVRKDLSYLGSYGTRGVGYDVGFLIDQVGRELGMTRDWPVVIVGLGNLGRALANYRGFPSRGYRIVGLIDADPDLVGEVIGGQPVRHIDDLEALVEAERVAVGIVATPAPTAQDVADRLVRAGVKAILNFAPVVLTVPPDVTLRKVDLSIELQVLTFYQHHQSRLASVEPDGESA